jgi:hypothetical protein
MILHVCVDADMIYFVYNIGICLFIMCISDDINILTRRQTFLVSAKWFYLIICKTTFSYDF